MHEVRRLQETVRDISDPMVVMRRVVDQALALIGPAEGAVVELAVEDMLVYACASGTLADHVGTRLRLTGSLSGLAIRDGRTLSCADAEQDGRVDRDACRRVGARSLLCVPLRRSELPVGVVKVTARTAHAFADQDAATLDRLASFISVAITAWTDLSRSADEILRDVANATELSAGAGGSQAAASASVDREGIRQFVASVLRPGIVLSLAAAERINRVITLRMIFMSCQPIIDLASGTVVGVEALARFPGPPSRPPDVWFEEARRAGLGVQLQLSALTAAVGLIDHLPGSDVFLSINIGPDAIIDPRLPELLAPAAADRIVLELTEHAKIDSYPRLRTSLQDIRARGIRLAIDDTGAGFASLGHILHLAPDLIKLDRLFITGIDLDPVRRALARSLVNFAQETGARVVAEGIETRAELETVRALGIPYGQGYFIGIPAPISSLATDYSHLLRGNAADRPQPCGQAPATNGQHDSQPRRGQR